MKKFRSGIALLLALLMCSSIISYLRLPVYADEIPEETGDVAEEPLEEVSETEETDLQEETSAETDTDEETDTPEETYESTETEPEAEVTEEVSAESAEIAPANASGDLFDPDRTVTQELIWERLAALKQQFPQGRYWNHVEMDENNIEGTTDQPCPDHSYDNVSTCNHIKVPNDDILKYQCYGFAEVLSYKLFGRYFSLGFRCYESGDIEDLISPGDVIKYGYAVRTTGHTVMVTGISGDRIRLVDCNSDNHCIIRWDGEMSLATYLNSILQDDNGLFDAPAEVSFLPAGYCGEDARYTIDGNGVLRITGTGYIDNKVFENNSNIKKVVIGEGIAGVGFKSFAGCTSLTEVVLPDSFLIIYKKSFYGCSKLSQINIPSGVLEIGEDAFYGCKVSVSGSVSNLENTSGVRNYGMCGDNVSYVLYMDGELVLSGIGPTYDYASHESPFYSWGTYVSGVTVKEGITRLGNYLLGGCYAGGRLCLAKSVESIGSMCFYNNGMTEVIFPDGSGLKTLEAGAFSYSKELVSIVLPEGLVTIGESAFSGCSKLKNISVPASVSSLGKQCFSSQNLEYVRIAEGTAITTLPEKAFYNCKMLKSFTVPEGVEYIGYQCFYGCTGLTSVVIPATVTKFAQGLFDRSGVKDVYLYTNPDDITFFKGSSGSPKPVCHVKQEYLSKYWKFTDKNNYRIVAWNVTFAGDLDQVDDVKLAGLSVSYDGDIGLNYYMELSGNVTSDSSAYMTFTYAGDKTTVIPVSEASRVTRSGRTYYVFKCNILPSEMTSAIKGQITYGTRTSRAYEYSVRDYAFSLLANRNDPAYTGAVPVVKAMLNYGAGVEKSLKAVSAANAVNRILPAEDRMISDIRITRGVYENNLDSRVTFAGATLTLGTENSLSLYFNSSDDLRFSISESNRIVTECTSSGYQVVRIRNIKAHELFDVSFTVTVAGHGTIRYSPERYCFNALISNDIGSDLKELIKSICLFSEAVKEYRS